MRSPLIRLSTLTVVAVVISLPARGAEPALPAVETNYSYMHAGDWAGRRFREIVQPSDIKRFVKNGGGGLGLGEKDTRENCDALLAHIIKSDEKAVDPGVDAQEGQVAYFVLLTKSYDIYFIDVLEMNVNSEGISAIILRGPNKMARIPIKGYHLPPRKQQPINKPAPPGSCENTSAQPPIVSSPAKVISVGDDASVLRAFKEYGYSEESFSLPAFSPGPNGSRATPRFFHLGNNQYIWVWHGERIESITQFRAVPHEHAYTDFVDMRELTSFRIPESPGEDAGHIDASRGQAK